MLSKRGKLPQNELNQPWELEVRSKQQNKIRGKVEGKERVILSQITREARKVKRVKKTMEKIGMMLKILKKIHIDKKSGCSSRNRKSSRSSNKNYKCSLNR
jgi:hypothetical protein